MTTIKTYEINDNYEDYNVNINVSEHAWDRRSERKTSCSETLIVSNIMKLGLTILKKVKRNIAIIDKVSNVAIFINIRRKGRANTLNIDVITILDKSTNVFVKNNTEIVKI